MQNSPVINLIQPQSSAAFSFQYQKQSIAADADDVENPDEQVHDIDIDVRRALNGVDRI